MCEKLPELAVLPYTRCDACYMIPSRVLCILLVVLQGAVLNYYLVLHNNRYWYAWIAGDVAMIFVFLVAFFISYRQLNAVRVSALTTTPLEVGSLPLGYFAWIVYIGMLTTRAAIIFKNFAWKLNEQDFFGPNTLKLNLSLSAAVFLLVLMSHHDALWKSARKHHIDILTQTVVFDILDSVDIVDVFFDKQAIDSLLPGLDWAIICIAGANLILPTLPLMTLSRIHFGYKPLPPIIATLHKLVLLFLVNIPLLVIRMVLWLQLNQGVSTFLMKNLIMVCLIIHDFYKEDQYRRRLQQSAADHELHMKMIDNEDINYNRC